MLLLTLKQCMTARSRLRFLEMLASSVYIGEEKNTSQDFHCAMREEVDIFVIVTVRSLWSISPGSE